MNFLKSSFLSIPIIVVILMFSSLYVVQEGEHAIILRLGRILEDAPGQARVKGPGLHFKWPIINTVRIFDTRLQTLSNQTSRIVTREKKDVLVDYYVKWRIENLSLYYISTGGNEAQAQTLLEQKVNDGLRAEFGKRDISEVVSGERSDVMAILRKQAAGSAKDLGIEVIDVRIKRIDLPAEVSTAVYERMRAEREQIANAHRFEGKAVAEKIRAQADASVTIILAKAKSEAARTRGEGEAIAAQIYADSYGKDTDFFALLKSLDAYQNAFNNKSDVLVLQPDSQFFKYFNTPTANIMRSNGNSKSVSSN